MRRNAALFVLISLLSGFGSTALTLAARIWVLDLTGSVSLAGLTGLCLYAPTFASPWLGALVDRLPRRPLLIWGDVVLGLTLLSLLTVGSIAGVWLIFLVLLTRGAGYVVLDAGETAILPATLPTAALGEVNGWRASAQEGMKLIAPLAGAGLYAWRGPVPVVLMCATMPLLAAACYALLRIRPGPSTQPAPAGLPAPPALSGRSARAGWVVLLRSGSVRVPVLVAAVSIAMSGLTGAAVLARVVHGLHLPATHLGLLASAQGAGSIVGGLLVGRLLARLGPARVAALGAALFAAGCVAWCLPWWPALIAGSAVVGFGLPWTLIAGITAVQTRTPEYLLGRAGATANMVMFGPVALAIPIGSVSVRAGARLTLVVAAGLALAAALGGFAAGRRLETSTKRAPGANRTG